MRPLVAHVVGARPNYMKIAPIYDELERRGAVEQRLIHTGQHYDASLKDVFFAELPLPRPHVELDVGSGLHGVQTARALEGLERTFLELRPEVVIAAGDVNSTLAAALAAVKLGIPVCHVEAGLRSSDWSMPEEHNRRLTDHVSTLLLTHCRDADENLIREGIPESRIRFVGNTMIDTLVARTGAARKAAVWEKHGLEQRRYMLVTLHRPTLVDDAELLRATVEALKSVAKSLPVIFPVHPRTRARIDELGIEPGGILFVPPLDYLSFVSLECGASAVVTDSGGVQEETTALGIPCFTVRDNTERPVTITRGTNTLLGLDPRRIAEIPNLLREARRIGTVPSRWDGHAGERAADAIEDLLGLTGFVGAGIGDAAEGPQLAVEVG